MNNSKAHIAIANIKGNSMYPNIKGTVTFQQFNNGVLVTSRIFGLSNAETMHNGFFAMHIHDGEECTGNESDPFKNSGSHYNPTNAPHPYHAGDLPPLYSNDGYAYSSVLINKFSVDDILEKTVIIHSKPDDFTSQPSGNAGDKIACGKIVSKMRHF